MRLSARPLVLAFALPCACGGAESSPNPPRAYDGVLPGAVAADAAPVPAFEVKSEFRIGAAGDTMLARAVEKLTLEAGDYTAAFGDMPPFTRALDAMFVNLECQIAKSGAPIDKGEKGPFYFHADPRMVNALVQTGIDVVNVANNHGMDWGADALLETLEHCHDAGIVTVGGGRDIAQASAPGFLDVHGTRVAFVGMNATSPLEPASDTTPGLNAIDYEDEARFLSSARASLERARDGGAEIVLFTIHWGPNYRTEPDDTQRRLTRALLDLGYDAFLGHSAHQFLGAELYDGKPILHDLGNFAFDLAPVPPHWNERNLLFVLHFEGTRIVAVEGKPTVRGSDDITSFATGEQADAIATRFVEMSAALGTKVQHLDDGRVMLPIPD